jgi:hypothetical protein
MEFFRNISDLPLAEKIANLHGLLATTALLIFGATVVVILILKRYRQEGLHRPLAYLLGVQTLLVGATSAIGIIAYVAYRTPDGARDFLRGDTDTVWLHNIAFEYKEYLCAITPWLLVMVAFFVVLKLGPRLYHHKWALSFVLSATIVSAVFLMLTAALAVLVSKVAPLQKFAVGSDFFSRGGDTVVVAAIITSIVLGCIFWLITRGRAGEGSENLGSIAAIMYGSAAGLTLLWVLNMSKEASESLRESLAYVESIGPYSGVVLWSLVTIAVMVLVIWLITLKVKRLSPGIAGVVLIVSALIQVVTLFPPFYRLFID